MHYHVVGKKPNTPWDNASSTNFKETKTEVKKIKSLLWSKTDYIETNMYCSVHVDCTIVYMCKNVYCKYMFFIKHKIHL